MKLLISLILTAGVASVIANPVTLVTQEENINIANEPSLTETSVSEINTQDATVPKSDPEPTKVEIVTEELVPEPNIVEEVPKFDNGEVDIVIEESVTPLEVVADEQNEVKIDADDYLHPGDQLIDNILAERIKDEIMDTAEGFAPLPLQLRKKHRQPARRRFAIRRRYPAYPYPYTPYRRISYYNPYYYYRPSSLRFY
ncbi:hypothetical protein HW555_004494 [Spodoptera exigua]|uniref:Uncharacterized protein n=1 Tax=Spodoptera exigua TaxID=7107 RepID=A0A835L7I3_SPOEX|nr:hypothetical protein HW555_004494 [Spodoptera exigua]